MSLSDSQTKIYLISKIATQNNKAKAKWTVGSVTQQVRETDDR